MVWAYARALQAPSHIQTKSGFQRLCLWWGVQGGKAPLAFLACALPVSVKAP